MLIDLSITSDFVFLINGDSYYDHGFSLCNRLGMQVKDYEALLVSANLACIDAHDKFKIIPKEWESFLSSWLFDDIDLDRPRFVNQQLDLDAILNSSTPGSKKRSAYYSLLKYNPNLAGSITLLENIADASRVLQTCYGHMQL
jgi:hypothetical protein